MGKEESVQNRLVIAVVVLSLICLCMYGIQGIYGFSLFPDEFGYWASAAKALGYDFSEITSIGSYYSFGYSLILIPIMKVFTDSIVAYRAAVIVNLLLQICSYFLIIRICDKIFWDMAKMPRLILGGIAVLYPSWIFYVQMSMSEALLFFMYTLVIYLMLKYLEKPTGVHGLLVVLAAVYMYTVHMRTIGVLFAVTLTVILDAVIRYRNATGKKDAGKIVKDYLPAVVTVLLLIAGFLFSLAIKSDIADSLYKSGAVDKVYVNDYSGQFGKIREIISPMGIGKLLVSITGKILYLSCATFGFGLIGIYSLAKRALKKDKNSFFILVASVSQFGVMCVYLLHSADLDSDRFDLFLHGRYFDFAIPMLMIAGIYEVLTHGRFLKKVTAALAITGACMLSAIIVSVLNHIGMKDPHGMLMIGMSYFLNEDDVRPVKVIVLSVILSGIICGIFIFVMTLYKRNKNPHILLIMFVVLVGLSYHACNHFIYIGQTYIYGDIQIADQIKDLRISGRTGNIVLLYEGGLEYIDTVQFRLRDEHISVEYIDENELFELQNLHENDIILVNFESDFNSVLEDKYEHSWESGHFDMYYN